MTIDILLSLLGQNIKPKEVCGFLEKYPSFKLEKANYGTQYAVSKTMGVALLFEPEEGPQGGKTAHLRYCRALFLYSEGKDGYKEYSGQIPLNFTFADTRSAMIAAVKPERSWKIGQGEVD